MGDVELKIKKFIKNIPSSTMSGCISSTASCVCVVDPTWWAYVLEGLLGIGCLFAVVLVPLVKTKMQSATLDMWQGGLVGKRHYQKWVLPALVTVDSFVGCGSHLVSLWDLFVFRPIVDSNFLVRRERNLSFTPGVTCWEHLFFSNQDRWFSFLRGVL